jgi:hypothetical protein
MLIAKDIVLCGSMRSRRDRSQRRCVEHSKPARNMLPKWEIDIERIFDLTS